ncbi:hypothetical protein R1flu_020275 [Riccia fluitans]|uniref:Uncharacterized protein n=1 Tax=Riccia fluitans TaxID=41844 RepID=A0ABD1ZM76_9MARC
MVRTLEVHAKEQLLVQCGGEGRKDFSSSSGYDDYYELLVLAVSLISWHHSSVDIPKLLLNQMPLSPRIFMAEALPSRLVQHGPREAPAAAHLVGNSNKLQKGEKKVRFEDHERAAGLAKLNEKARISLEGVIVKDRRTGELLPFGEHQQHHHHHVLLQQQKKVDDTNTVIHESEEVRLKGKLRWLFEQDRMFWESNESRACSPKHVIEVAKPKPSSDVQQPKEDEPEQLYSKTKLRNGEIPAHDLKSGGVSFKVAASTGGTTIFRHGDGCTKSRRERGGSFRFDKDRKQQQSRIPKDDHHGLTTRKCNEVLEFRGFGPGVRVVDRDCSSPTRSGEFRDAKGSFDESLGVERPADFSSSEELLMTTSIPFSKEVSKSDKLQKSALTNVSSHGSHFNPRKVAPDDEEGEEEEDDVGVAGDIIRKRSSKLGTTNSDTSILKESRQQKTSGNTANLSLRPQADVRAPALVEAEISELDLGGRPGGDQDATDYEDAGTNSPLWSSDDEEERRKVGAAGYIEDVRDRNTLLKAKCDLLAKEKDIAVRKWKRSCVEIEQAAQMAQALRSAIETLLEVSIGNENSIDIKSRRSTLEDHTRALRARMEKLRRKAAAPALAHPRQESERSPGEAAAAVEGKPETSKETSGVRGLASPQVPRDTENKVEDLKARLEKLMLATNSRVNDEAEHVISRPRGRKKTPVKDTLHREKTELKMTDWYKSLSAELSGELILQPNGCSLDKCDMSSESGQTREPSCNPTPATSKQVSPHHRSRQAEDTASIQSTEETKIRVIHKIAEEVRAESEQWYQVQELLQRVGEDMKRLQEACGTWERRALLAEAQVETLLNEDQERKEKLPAGDDKMAELQTEMVRLKDTVDEVRKQLANVDPSRWFEAAHKFGYAFAPVIRPTTVSAECSPRHHHHQHQFHSAADSLESRESMEDRVRRELRQKRAMDSLTDNWQQQQQHPNGSGSSRERSSRPIPAARRDHKLQSSQWANQIAKAEEDEILLHSKMQGRSEVLHVPRSAEFIAKRVGSDPEDEISSIHSHQDSLSSSRSSSGVCAATVKPLKLESKFDDNNYSSMKDESKETTFLESSPVSKEGIADNLSSSLTRSPLKVVLGNVAPSKENKKPF